MSTPRKPKPPDKGALPEHKPSRKVALDEVMRTLQDLVSNELAVKPAPASDSPRLPESTRNKTPSRKRPADQATDSLPAATQYTVSPSASSSPDDAIDFDPTEPHADNKTGAIDKNANTGNAKQARRAPSVPNTAARIPAGGLQQELPYLEADHADAADAAPTADIQPANTEEKSPPPLPDSDDPSNSAQHLHATTFEEIDNYQIKSAGDSPSPAIAKVSADIDWDDIPVLDEVVDMDAEMAAATPDSASNSPASRMVSPVADAHRLAVQVAARLNVELRKSGQPGLSSDIITRLARLLQEALAKEALTMENTPPDKH